MNDIVTFTPSRDPEGRSCAVRATLAGDKLKERVPQKRNTWVIVFALGFLSIVEASVMTGNLPVFIGIAYAALSLVTFLAYAFDKSAAKSGTWRTAEGTLHVLGLAGGWPGALIAQQTLRHKSKKAEFRIVLWVTVLLNGGAFVWLLSAGGGEILESVTLIR